MVFWLCEWGVWGGVFGGFVVEGELGYGPVEDEG